MQSSALRDGGCHLQVPLSHQVDVAGFHSEATRLLASGVPPDSIEWSAAPAQAVALEELEEKRAAIRHRAARAIIPQSFVRMSELVVLHRDPQRFALLYRALWRLVHEPHLRKAFGDPDLAHLRQMAQAVRRDLHKMKTRLAFRTVSVRGEPVPVAWYEPAHYASEAVAAWRARSDPARQWILLTPDRSLRWDGARLLGAPAVAPARPPGGERSDAEWSRVLEAMPWA